MPPSGGSPARYALTKNCTFPFTAGKCCSGWSWYSSQPSLPVGCRSPPVVLRGTERMNTSAPRTARPRWSVTLMRTVIGVDAARHRVRGEPDLRDDQPVARCPQVADRDRVARRGGVWPPTTAVWFDSADRAPVGVPRRDPDADRAAGSRSRRATYVVVASRRRSRCSCRRPRCSAATGTRR